MLRHYFFKFFYNVLNSIYGAVITLIFPKALGPSSYGNVSYLNDLFSNVFNIFDGSAANSFYNKLNKTFNQELLTYLFIINFFVFTIILIFIFFIFKNLSSINFLSLNGIEGIIIFLSIFYCFNNSFSNLLFKSLDSAGKTASLEIVKCIYVLVKIACTSFFTYYFIVDDKVFLYSIIIPSIFLNFSLFFFLFRNFNFFKFRISKLAYLSIIVFKKIIVPSIPLATYATLSATCLVTEKYILKEFGSSTEIGFFNLAMQVGILSFIFTESFIPLFHRSISSFIHNEQLLNETLTHSLTLFFIISTFFSTFFMMNSDFLLSIIAGNKFNDASSTFKLLLLYPAHQSLGQILGTYYVATGEFKKYRNISSFFLIAGLLISFLLIKTFALGSIGLAQKYIFLQILSVNFLFFFMFKLKDRFLFVCFQVYYFSLFLIINLIVSSIFPSQGILNLLIKFFSYCSILLLVFLIRLKCFSFFPNCFLSFKSDALHSLKFFFKKPSH